MAALLVCKKSGMLGAHKVDGMASLQVERLDV